MISESIGSLKQPPIFIIMPLKKLYPYIALLIAIPFSLIPPIDFKVVAPMGDMWFLLILLSAFFGLYILFLNTNLIVKAIPIFAFINCFFSSAPYISFNAYVSVVACCYFYILCSRIENWQSIFRALRIVLFLNLLLMILQFIGKDTLLNFGLPQITAYGIIGQRMQMGSFSVVLSVMLLPLGIIYIAFPFLVSFFCASIWTTLSAVLGLCTYLYFKNKLFVFIFLAVSLFMLLAFTNYQGKIKENIDSKTGRITVWKNTIKLSNQRPWIGYGIGTYKVLYPSLSGMNTIPWKATHNFWLQLLFETGYPATVAVLAAMIWLFFLLWSIREIICLSGLVMLNVDWLVHFPDRMLQAVLIMILFFAFCKYKLTLNLKR